MQHTHLVLGTARQQLQVTLGVQELAALMHCHPASIYRNLSVAPHLLPPTAPRAAKRRVVWLTSVVLNWLSGDAGKVQQAPHEEQEAPEGTPRPAGAKRGRPTKVEQIRRRLAARQGGNHGV